PRAADPAMPLAGSWLPTDYSFVLLVRSNPKPNDFFTIENAYSSMSLSNTCRIDRPCRMNFLEAETGMIWVSLKMSISCTSLLLNLFGKLLETGTEARCRV